MPGRAFFAGNAYRYGFNGKEESDEISEGAISFEARIYDTRIGRFFSTDPREAEYAWQSTYVYFKNCPISVLDVLGMGDGDGDKKKVNVYVTAKNRKKSVTDCGGKQCEPKDDDALESSYQSAISSNVKVFEVDNMDEYITLVTKWKSENPDIEIGNLIFDSHGSYENASFRIGSEIFNKNKISSLSKLKSTLNANTTITILACHSGGGLQDNGVEFVQKIANTIERKVLANKSWSPGGDIFADYGLGIIGPKYQYVTHWNLTKTDKAKKYAYANRGIWITASPQKGKEYNIEQHGAIYLDNDGDYHLRENELMISVLKASHLKLKVEYNLTYKDISKKSEWTEWIKGLGKMQTKTMQIKN